MSEFIFGIGLILYKGSNWGGGSREDVESKEMCVLVGFYKIK
jgi:hypothetical protein